MVRYNFIKCFSTNSRIEQAVIMQTFLETRNWKILSAKLSTRLTTSVEKVYRKRQRNKRIVFSFHGHLELFKNLLDAQHGAL